MRVTYPRCHEPLVITDEIRSRAERYDRYRYPLQEEVVSCELATHTPVTACAAYLLHEEDSHVQVWARWNPAGGPVHVKETTACPTERDDAPCLLFHTHPGPCTWAITSPFDPPI
ncbi:hypothetical protein [Streptomyces uncialis]|uniref:hypothetical protein n=1 Tax=Streptomyces uncialis TaxID=1048205 RepID=UPI00340A0455